MARRKYSFPTREAAERAYRDESDQHQITQWALNDALRGRLVWDICEGTYRAQVSRLDAPSNGGIVVVTWTPRTNQKPWASAYSIDAWLADILRVGREYYWSRDDELGQEYRLALKVRDARNAYWARAKEAQEQATAQTA